MDLHFALQTQTVRVCDHRKKQQGNCSALLWKALLTADENIPGDKDLKSTFFGGLLPVKQLKQNVQSGKMLLKADIIVRFYCKSIRTLKLRVETPLVFEVQERSAVYSAF